MKVDKLSGYGNATAVKHLNQMVELGTASINLAPHVGIRFVDMNQENIMT